MKTDYNSIAFTPDEVERGLLKGLLDYIVTYNTNNKDRYFDTHIWNDGYSTVVEFIDRSYDFDYDCGRFEYVADNQKVMTEVILPDEHIEIVYPGSEDKVYKEWLDNNPGWRKNSFGIWTNTPESLDKEDYCD